MHILLVHQAFAALDEPGGTRHHEFARYLAGRGHRVTVIASPVSYLTGTARQGRIPWVTQKQDGEQITVLRAYTYPALHHSFAHRVFSFLSFMFSSFFIGLGVKEVDLVWGTSPPIFQGWTAWALARIKRVPFLFEVRDLWPAFAIAVGVLHNRLFITAARWLEQFLYRHADRVVVNSPGFIDHVKSRGARQVYLVPNGADPRMFSKDRSGERFRDSHGIGGKCIVLYAGAHGMSNDLDVVLEAARQMQDQKDLVFVFLGDGKEKPALVEMADKMALANVLFLPPVPKSDMPDALAAADICLAILKPIALYRTVYPNKVFDYLAAGKPVVLAMDGVIKDVVEQAHAGIPAPPGDATALAEAVRQLAGDRLLRESMGRQGRLFLKEHFDRARLADDLARLMETMP